MNKKLIIIPLILLLFLPFFISKSSYSNINFTTEEINWINEHKTITLSYDPIYAPIEFMDESNNYSGLSSDYIKWINSNTNLNIKIETSKNWTKVLEKLKTKNIDLSGAITKTTKRNKYILFTEPFISLPNIIIGRDTIDKNFTLSDMDGFTVAVVKNYAIHDYIEENYPNINIITVDSSKEGLKRVSFGMTDAFIGDIAQVSSNLDNLNLTNLKYINETEFTYNLSFGVRDDYDILVSILNKSLASIPQEEKDKIYNKWINIKPYENRKLKSYMLYTSIALLLIISLVLINNIYLSKKIKEKTKELTATNNKLELLNNNLNNLVLKRTGKLSESIKKLTKTKDELSEIKKMISLNELIIGLSNELDSPIGNIKTINSFMRISNDSFSKKLTSNDISKDYLIKYSQQLNENINLLDSSIRKTNHLNSSLKKLKLHEKIDTDNFINLNLLITELKKEYIFKYKNINMDLIINMDDNLNDLEVPKNQISFIIKELIDNSLFHAYNQTNIYEILLNFIITKENLIISIKDHGMGIKEENLSKIFDPFFTTTRQRGSIGLGLFIVYNIVNNILKGKIDLKTSDAGTTFKITIPRNSCCSNQK
ncbi:MAG: transporter substrate-binding domain-containing protein [Bacillota bacterium]|nr:transporter substrate-binding domain-containing protein [Bacillota bacterium]